MGDIELKETNNKRLVFSIISCIRQQKLLKSVIAPCYV